MPEEAFDRRVTGRCRHGTVAACIRGCNPIGVHRPFAAYLAFLAKAGTHIAAGVALSEGGTLAEKVQTRLLAEPWVPAFAGKAREAHSVVTMLVETN